MVHRMVPIESIGRLMMKTTLRNFVEISVSESPRLIRCVLQDVSDCMFSICLRAELRRKLPNLIPPNLQQTYQLGIYRLTQTPAYKDHSG